MDDFEFSVDISDRDWQCFFSQCEECNVLPPSLAGLEDSGMSDMDDLGAAFAKRVQKKDLNTGLLEEDEPAGSPCEGHLEELYLGKHSSGGIESVLSGSEEDIHLQSVNMFFEQMKSSSDSKRTAEQGQVGATQNRAVQGQLRGGGLSAKCTDRALPKNIPNLNSVSARGEAATGAKTTKPVSTIRYPYSVRTDESSSESSTSLYIRHPYLKTQLYIESSPENTANEHTPLNKADTSTPHSNKVIYIDKETCMSDVKDHASDRKTSDLIINPGPVVNGKWTEDKSTQVSQSDTDSTYKPLSKESSPCASVKRKRRKKRRLSVEPVENLFTCERLYDSEDELFTWRRAIDPCFCNWSGLKHQHIKCGFMPPLGQYTLSSSLPAGVEAKEIQPKPHHSQYQSVLTQANFVPTGLTKIWPSIETKTNGGFAGDKELTKVKEDLKVTGIPLESVASSNDNNRNEVKSLTDSIFPSAESNDQRVAIGQSDRGSIAKLVILREEAETKKVSQCQRETETHQQLETQSPIACQSCHMVENMTPPPCKRSISTVTELLDHKARHHAPQSAGMASKETSSILHNQSLIPCNFTMDGTVQKLEYHIENGTNQVDLSQNHQITNICETEAPQELDEGNLIASGNTDQISELQALLENQSRSTSYSTFSSCHTPETEPQTNENIVQTLECTTVTQNGLSLQEESTQVICKDGKMDAVLQNKVQCLSNDVEEPCWDQVEVAMTNCESEELIEPVKSDNTVFAMSSFWKEMEKLTINDILGLRKENKAQSSFLPSLQETDDSDCFTLSDLGCCSQVEEKKHDQECKDVRTTIPGPVDYSLSCGDTSSSVLWENKPVPMSLPPANIYNDKITLNDISGPQISPDVPRGLRRMSKNITVQNLHSLESDPFSYKCNTQSTLKLQVEDTCNDIGYLPKDPVPKGDLKLSSMIENFRISISDLYSYFFCDKQPDSRLEPPIDDIVSNFTAGDSVSENYDHFFSEFDTDTFFYTEEVKPELVPIFSCSRSSKTKMKFRDPYDYFLVSSSDNSSSESSDEEDSKERAPIRVVTRFTRKASSKDIVTDAYEHFYTDRDLKQDFFKTTFSFRNINFTENNVSKKTSTNAKAVRLLQQESRSYNIKAMPITVLGNQDFVFPDSVLCNFDDQIITKLQQPLIYKNLQTAVANPNLDAPLLPLKQSDMCLICIAFASWVLKTANPQVGDAWKAVLLANVSALSAIRYLRKYVKGETKADEKKPNLKALLYPESMTK